MNINPFFEYLQEQDYTWDMEKVNDPEYIAKAIYTISNTQDEKALLILGVAREPQKKTKREDGKLEYEMTMRTEFTSISMSEEECEHLVNAFTFYTGFSFNVIN